MVGKPIHVVLALLVALSTLAAACSGATSSPGVPSSSGAPSASGASGSTGSSGAVITKTDLTVAQSTEPQSLDPQRDAGGPSSTIQDNVLEKLVSNGPDMKLRPELATEWKTSEDGKTITFKLRSGVKFHDGTAFDAEAVKFTFDRALGKIDKKKSRYETLLTSLDRVEVVDPTTVQFVLKQPDAPFLNALAHNGSAILSPTAVQKLGDEFARNPVGTGPFKFVEWKQGESLTIAKNPDYWRKDLPKLDKVTVKIIPDGSTRVISLETGAVDMALELPELDAVRLKSNSKYKLTTAESLRTVFYRLNPTIAPFDDIKVRQAFVEAINVKDIAATILEGLHRPAERATFAPAVYGVSKKVPPYEYSIEHAKKLLDEAGWVPGPDGVRQKEGKPLQFTLWTTNARYPKDSQISENVARTLAQIGMKTDVQTMEWGAYRDSLFNRKFQAFLFGAGVSTGDVDYVISMLFHSSSQYAQGKIPDEEAIMKARAEVNPEKRLAMYDDLQTKMRDQYIWMPIYWQSILMATSDQVQGYVQYPDESSRFAETYIGK